MPEEKNFLQELHDLPRTKTPHAQMITPCLFKRKQDSDWEKGIAIGRDLGDVDIITTFTGEVVPAPVWNFQRQPMSGCIWLQP